ncbi:MAG TPA: riboflavin synthase [Candidatus Saccharimonadales bacterium]|nr:riboflavin synthase [Candidatus Saccharimonadales bacterium]
MFTGIIEEAGVVESIRAGQKSIELDIRSEVCGKTLKQGDSLAVNGCCLTVVVKSRNKKSNVLRFDLLQETWLKTNLQFLKLGARVNLERSLRADGRLDGHFVTGHIDGLGRIEELKVEGKDHFLQISAAPELLRYIVYKGSIAVDGISLTVAKVSRKNFSLWIIPHTFEVTALRQRKIGDAVNLETDILGKYVERFLAKRV